MTILQSFSALLYGFLTIVLPIAIITAALRKYAPRWTGSQDRPHSRYLVVNLGCSFAAAIAGGFVTARLSKELSLRYALVLALGILLLNGMSAVQQRGRQPLWYQLLMVAIMPACVLLGGWLCLMAI